MKKTITLFVSAFLILGQFTSCKNEDDSVENTESVSKIQGNWKIVQFGEITNGQEVLQTYDNECSTKFDNIAFTSSTWETRFYDVACTEELDFGTYVIVENSLIIVGLENGASYSETSEILTLNNSTLKVKYKEVSTSGTTEVITVYKKM